MFDLLAAAASNHGFDVEAATRAYLDTLQGPARAKSDAYFEGGYWLILWGTAVGVLIDWLFLRFRMAHRLRVFAEKRSKRPWLVTWMTAIGYFALGSILTLPWSIYTGFFREREYGLMNSSFADWAGEGMIDFAITLAIAPVMVVAVYALIRRAPRTWWIWSTGVIGTFLLVGMVIAPVFIAPLFNTYTEMEQGPLRTKIEAIAGKYDIPAEHIYVFDASKQTKRISANVSGLGPTIRISLNDNLLNRTSEPEILAVLGHEMGHYKLNHVWFDALGLLAVFGFGLFVASRVVPSLIVRHGEAWGVRDIADPASLPVLFIVFAIYMLFATPVTNSIIRTAESQADAFGLEAAREPDGFAKTAMRLSEYRKIEPGPVEEALFFDHPSGRTRVRMAMEWKARNVANPQIVVPERGYLESTQAAKPTAQ
jgi:STE24 endopeptidase